MTGRKRSYNVPIDRIREEAKLGAKQPPLVIEPTKTPPLGKVKLLKTPRRDQEPYEHVKKQAAQATQ